MIPATAETRSPIRNNMAWSSNGGIKGEEATALRFAARARCASRGGGSSCATARKGEAIDREAATHQSAGRHPWWKNAIDWCEAAAAATGPPPPLSQPAQTTPLRLRYATFA